MLNSRSASRPALALIATFLTAALFAAVTMGCGSNQAKTTSTAAAQPTTAAPSASPAPTGTTSTPPPTGTPSTPAPTIQFSASPTSIVAGQTQSVTLTWTTTNATSVSIQPGFSNLAASGSTTIPAPTATTTYTATATGSGGSTSVTATITVTAAPPPPTPGYAFGHVVIVALENKDYSEVVGNTSAMPYLNSLITKYGLATNYYANTHPSIDNYFMLTAGQMVANNNDSFTGTVSVDNVVRELNAAGKTWRAYAEDLPYAGYTGPDAGNYIERHNPLSYFSDVRNDPAVAAAGIVPFTQFATDLAAGKLPQYVFITPNMYNDAHECSTINACLTTADNWLQQNIAPLIVDPNFAKDGVLIIWFDEADTDNTHGGGLVPLVFVSPAWSKSGYQSATFGQHQNTLRFTMDALGVTSVPGAGADPTTGWNEFFIAH